MLTFSLLKSWPIQEACFWILTGRKQWVLGVKGGPEPSNFEDLCLVNVSVKYLSKLCFGTSKIQPELKYLKTILEVFTSWFQRAKAWEHEFGRVPSISFIFTGSKIARIDWFWLRGWLINKGAICTRSAPLFWNFIFLFQSPRTRLVRKIGSQNQSIAFLYATDILYIYNVILVQRIEVCSVSGGFVVQWCLILCLRIMYTICIFLLSITQDQ